MLRTEKGVNLFKEDYNCCQSVLLTFADELPLTESELYKFSSAFGGGFAGTRNLCGAVSAIGMVVGLFISKQENSKEEKNEIYVVVKKLTDKFTARNKNLNCKDLLLNIKGSILDFDKYPYAEEYFKVRPCVKFVIDAIEILEEYLANHNFI